MDSDPGLYTVENINQKIRLALEEEDGAAAAEYYSLSGDASSGKIIHECRTASGSLAVNWGDASTELQNLVGQPTNISFSSGTKPRYQYATNVAQFNSTDHFYIHSDLVSDGESINGIYSQAISKHVIQAGPGSLSSYEPINPSIVPADNLKSISGRSSLRFWLTDASNNPVTMSEYWSLRIVISYDKPIVFDR